ncbi:hypothetical protein [Microbacterium sp.]|uniref:hypothetical protein n=1 Tax=Microbacterium sp. TaxID=51671 RepID=UPI0025FC18DE|nr:hypothetical protein [Microbacterium sp.]
MSAWRIAARAWRVLIPAVAANAVVQAATVAFSLTPAFEFGFVLLVLMSFAALTASLAVISAAASAAAATRRFQWPGWWLWAGAALAILATTASGLASPVLVPVVVVLVLMLLPGVAARDQSTLAGLRMFRAAPLHASLLAVGSLLTVIVLWILGLVLGLFVTGPISAFMTWLVFGTTAAILVCAWTSIAFTSGVRSR